MFKVKLTLNIIRTSLSNQMD